MAPEVLLTNGKGEYTEKVDIWSLGVVLFTMLSGTLPFADDYGTPATDQIKLADFQFRSSKWKNVSSTAKSLIRELLTIDVKKRPSIDELMQHRWMRDINMITTTHAIMKLPIPDHVTRLAMSAPAGQKNHASDVFVRPYEVDIDSENVQSSKRRRLR